jgi:HEPN domain-containing protein
VDKKEKYMYWEEHAQYDLDTAKAMFDTHRYLYSAFMCQQAIEKIVKGIFVLYTGREPLKTHNIALIFDNLCDEEAFNKYFDDNDLELCKDKYNPFFVRLMGFYISTRYPAYKEKLTTILSNDGAREILEKSQEVFLWIQSLKKYLI